MSFTPGGLGGGGGGGGGGATARVHTPAVALFEHPEDATATFLADTGSTEGLTVTLREPLEYGQDTSQWSIVGAQRYQGVAAVNAGITGQTFSHASYAGEFATASLPDHTGLTGPTIAYDTDEDKFQYATQTIDWRDVTVADWTGIFGADPSYRPWQPSGGWGNDLATAGAYEYANQAALEANLTTNYAQWTGSIYASTANVLWFDQSDGDVKIFGAVTAPVAGTPADPVHVTIDPTTMTITAYYNLVAGGALTAADTLGDLKGAFDTAGEGLSSEYVGGGAMDDDMTRPFATVDQFSAAALRGLRLLLTDPVAAGAAGNNFGLVNRARFPGGAEVDETQAHILIYTSTARHHGVRIALDADIQAPNEHGTLVDVSSGALGNEWTFTALSATGQFSNIISVDASNRQIIYYAPFALADVAAGVLHDACNAQAGVSATYFGGDHQGTHPFDGSHARVNTLPQRFHGGRDYHAATSTPEPITVTVGPTHAHTRLYTVTDGGILLSLTNPAHDAGNGFYFETSEGSPLAAALLPTEERITLAVPSSGSTAAEILAALNAVDGLSAVYFGTEDGTTTVMHDRFGRHEMLGGLDATEIEIQYAPVASGGISDVDTMGDVKTAWDAGDGRSSVYYGGADMNTEASRLVPWEHRFENGRTDVISLAGFGLGPEQNEFTGADRVAAEAARDTYAAANPTWVEAYRGQPAVWIVLRWGTTPGTQIGQTLRATASNPPIAGDWIDQNIALRGEMGSQGSQGSYDVEIYQNAAANPGRPAGGSVVVATGAVTPPTGWATTESQPPAGQDTFRARARINPSTQSGTVAPMWGTPVDIRAEVSTAEIDARIAPPARATNPSGEFDAARIPDLDASKVATGTLDDDRIPAGVTRDTEDIAASRVAGALDDSNIPAGIARDADVTAAITAGVKEFARAGERGVQVGDMDSESATDDQVATADGSGGVAWEDQQGGGTPTPPTPANLVYFGWSTSQTIVTADLDDTLARVNSDADDYENEWPANASNAYMFVAVRESDGVPTELYRGVNPVNQITGFPRQAGTVNDGDGNAHIVIVSANLFTISASARPVRVGFA